MRITPIFRKSYVLIGINGCLKSINNPDVTYDPGNDNLITGWLK